MVLSTGTVSGDLRYPPTRYPPTRYPTTRYPPTRLLCEAQLCVDKRMLLAAYAPAMHIQVYY